MVCRDVHITDLDIICKIWISSFCFCFVSCFVSSVICFADDLSSDAAGGGAAAKLSEDQLISIKSFVENLSEEQKEPIGDLQSGIIKLHPVVVYII